MYGHTCYLLYNLGDGDPQPCCLQGPRNVPAEVTVKPGGRGPLQGSSRTQDTWAGGAAQATSQAPGRAECVGLPETQALLHTAQFCL